MCRPIGSGFCAVLVWKRVNTLLILVWNRVWFSGELRENMNAFIVSIPNEQERKRNMRIRNGFDEYVCLRSNLSNDNMIISAQRPGLKTGMDFRGLVWKRARKSTFFGLKSGQDLENRAAHSHQEFPGFPPRENATDCRCCSLRHSTRGALHSARGAPAQCPLLTYLTPGRCFCIFSLRREAIGESLFNFWPL